jgi:hypothetical protein
MTQPPRRDDARTRTCPVCQARFAPTGRQQYCSSACRKAAWRRRHYVPAAAPLVPAFRSRREHTIYECPGCGERLLGEQRCPDCGIFGRRLGPGGSCPHCGEAIPITEVIRV